MQKPLKKLLLTLVLCSLFLVVPLAMAEDAAGTATTEVATAPPGAATFMFLLGVGAILIVGLAMIGRDSFRGDSSS